MVKFGTYLSIFASGILVSSQSLVRAFKATSPKKSEISDPAVFTSNLQASVSELDDMNAAATASENTSGSSTPDRQPLPNKYPDSSDIEEIIDQIGSTCSDNTACDGSTFCCSKGRCVPGSICYKGQKQAYDHCDYGFECLSRCCFGNVCSPVI